MINFSIIGIVRKNILLELLENHFVEICSSGRKCTGVVHISLIYANKSSKRKKRHGKDQLKEITEFKTDILYLNKKQ